MKTTTSRPTLIAALAALAILGVESRRAWSEPLDLASHLPAGTTVFITLDDLAGSWAKFPGTPLGRTFSQPEVAEFLKRLGEGQARVNVQSASGFPLPSLPIKFPVDGGPMPGRVSFALLAPTPGTKEEPGLVGSLALGEGRDELVLAINSILEQLRSADPGRCVGRVSESGDGVSGIRLMDVDLSYFWRESTIVFGTRRRDLDAILGSLSSVERPPTATLAELPRFAELRRSTKAGAGGMFLYVATGNKPGAAPESGLLDVLGVTGIQAVGVSSRTLEDGSGETRIRIVSPGEDRGLLDVLGRDDSPLRSPRYLAPNAIAGMTIRIDRAGALALARRLAGVVDPAHRDSTDIRAAKPAWPEDLARAIGDEISLHVAAPRGGGFIPELGIVILLRDVAAAEKAIARAASTSTGLRMRTFQRRDRRYYRLDPRQTSPVLTSMTIADGVLVAGSSITVLDDMLKRGAGADALSLAGSDEYRAAIADVPADAGAVLYVDTPRLFRWGYNMLGPVLLMGVNLSRANLPGVKPLSWADFPSSDVLVRHIGPAVSWLERDAGGLTAISRSDVQNEITSFSFLIGLGFASTSTEAARPPRQVIRVVPPRPKAPDADADRTRREAWRRLDETNLTFFRHVFNQYRQMHDGRYPPDLAAFFGPGPARGPHFYSPADREAWKAWQEGRDHPSSYEYIGPGIPFRVEAPGRFPVIHNRAPYHENRRLVLFLSGEIKLVPEAEFQALLAEARRSLEK